MEVQDSLKRQITALTAAEIAHKIQVGATARASQPEKPVETAKSSERPVVAKPSVASAIEKSSATKVTGRGPRPVVAPLSSAPAFGKVDTTAETVRTMKEMEKMTVTKGITSFLYEEFSSDDESE